MLVPVVLTRMEEWNEFSGLWIKRREVWAFVKIAVRTGQAKIGQTVVLDVLARLNVLDVKRQKRGGRLRQYSH